MFADWIGSHLVNVPRVMVSERTSTVTLRPRRLSGSVRDEAGSASSRVAHHRVLNAASKPSHFSAALLVWQGPADVNTSVDVPSVSGDISLSSASVDVPRLDGSVVSPSVSSNVYSRQLRGFAVGKRWRLHASCRRYFPRAL